MTNDTLERRINGVDVPALFATLDAVKEQPAAARFQFRVATEWVSGTHNRSVVNGFYGVGQEQVRARDFVLEADHPAVLVGEDHAPTPAELLLHALSACLTSGLVNIAAARGVALEEVRCTVEGDIDLNGILGLDESVRNGYEAIRVVFHVKGGAEAEWLAKLVAQARNRSAVFDVITNGVPVTVDVATG